MIILYRFEWQSSILLDLSVCSEPVVGVVDAFSKAGIENLETVVQNWFPRWWPEDGFQRDGHAGPNKPSVSGASLIFSGWWWCHMYWLSRFNLTFPFVCPVFSVKTTRMQPGRFYHIQITPNSGKSTFCWFMSIKRQDFVTAGHWRCVFCYCRYSYAIVGINLTEMAYSLMSSGALKPHFYNTVSGKPQMQHFHEFYCKSAQSLYVFRSC